MNYQECATLSKLIDKLLEEFFSFGFKVSRTRLEEMIEVFDIMDEVDELGQTTCYRWVYAAKQTPGDIEDSPTLVFCCLDPRPGSAVAEDYRYVA